jgi:hypothetical protein
MNYTIKPTTYKVELALNNDDLKALELLGDISKGQLDTFIEQAVTDNNPYDNNVNISLLDVSRLSMILIELWNIQYNIKNPIE